MRNFLQNLKNVLSPIQLGHKSDSILSRFCLASLILMTMGVVQAWGKDYYAQCRVESRPATGGYVSVWQDAQEDDSYSFVTSTTDQTGTKKGWGGSFSSSTSIDFYAYQKTNPGYTFKGWSTDKNATSGNTTQYDHKYNYKAFSGYQNNCKYYSLSVSTSKTNSGSPQVGTYYAIYAANEYTLTYNVNGGNAISPTTKKVTYHSAYGELPSSAMTRTGYTFAGWYTSATGGTQVTASTQVTTADNHTIYAHWTANDYTVTLNNHDATTTGSASISVTYNNSKNLTATPAITVPAKTDYTFGGYYTAENGGGLQIIAANGNVNASVSGYTDADKKWIKADDVTLHAKWVLNSKTITLNNQSATTAGTASIEVLYKKNTNLTATPAIVIPARTGYTFEGYYTAKNGGGLQIIAKNGNVNASVSGYTDADKKWQYDGDVTLYAYWKQNQSIAWNQTITNPVRSEEITLTATAGSDLSVYYTATSNNGTVSISENKITCLTAGEVTVTAHQDGNSSWNATTATKTFTIVEHAITNNPTATSITYEQALSNSTLSGGTANVDGSWSWKYPTSVPNAGTANQVAVFTPSSSVISAYPLECEVSVTVAKATPDVTCTIANSYEVDDASLDLQTLWTREGNGTITYSKVSFTQTGNNNDDATTPAITNNRYLSLGQAGNLRIQMAIAEGSNYVARTVTKDITINKKSNALSCSWGSWSKDMNVDAQTGVTFSANNAQTPIVVEQTSGDEEGNVIASYSSATNKITSIYNIGTATWSVSQAENYKYVAAETKTLTVNVVKGSTTCYILQDDDERNWSTISSTTYGDGSVYLNSNGQRLQFQVKRSAILGFTNNDHFSVKYSADGSNWSTLKKLNTLENADQWYDFDLDISALTIKYIKFESETGATGNRHVRNVRITRKKWFKLEDKDGNEISSLEMPTNTLGGNHTTAKFTVDYSTCADQIKVVCNHQHITVSPASFASEGNGTKEITVTYACDDPESIDGVITVYTPYENKTINVHADTEKKSQEIEWSDLFVGETVSLPQTFTSNDAASATSKLPVTYTSGNSEIIEVAEDGLSFTVVGTGTTTLTASQNGNELWKSTSDTKTVIATNKKIQRIKWNQQFTRSLAPSQEIPLTATVTVLNIATGVETESVERSAEIVYTCPADNGVIEILNETNIRVLGYGNTTITASVAGNEEYEAASSVTLPVRVREMQTGDCDMPLVLEQNDEIEFFQGNTQQITGSAIAINHANGIPDKLSFDVRGAAWKLAIEYYKGGIIAQQSTDNKISWSDLTASAISPAKGETESSGEIQLNPNATHIRFVRPSGGQGYHYVGNIHITRLPYLLTENTTIDLGNISVGEKRDFTIPVSYCSVRGNMSISKQYSDNGLTIDELIEAECGDMNTYDIQASIMPTVVGPWLNMVTVRDPLSNMYLNVTINATIQKGDQVITWNPSQDILATEVPVLNAVASSGLSVSYAVTSGNNTVARMDNDQVVILQPGTFDITASQNGNSNYNAAPQLVKTFTVTAETLTLLEAPTATGLTYGQTLSASTLTGGSVKDSKHNPVAGTFSWQAGNTRPNAGEEQEMAVVFTPSLNPAWYNTLQTNAEITVIKATPAMTANDVVLTYGAAASSVELSTATGSVAGNWTWTDSRKEDMLAAGNYTMDVHFTPTGADANNYNELNTTVSVTVEKANTTLSWTNAPENVAHDATGVVYAASSASDGAVTYAIIAGGSYASIDAESGELTILESGHEITVQASQAAGTNYNAPSAITVTVSIEAAPVGPNTFIGAEDSDWENPNNWTNGLPTGDAPDVIVSGELEITEDISVGNLTIEKTGSVAIITGGTLTVTGQTEERQNGYGDLHVADDGVLSLAENAQLEVRHFILDAKLAGINNDAMVQAASGQVNGEGEMDVNGEAYFDLSFDPSGAISYGWYDFTVPFEVNINGGIARINSSSNKVMVRGTDFIIMEADEANRAAGGKGWRTLNGGVLQPGKLYTITLDASINQNTLRFTWNGNGNLMNGESYEAKFASGEDATLNGWNGMGNGMLRHGYPQGDYKMQSYNHGTNTYDLVEGTKTFAVGSAFFIQVGSAGDVNWTAAEATLSRPLYAPKREALEVEEFKLSLRHEGTEKAVDVLYFSASEEATEAYVIGHDLVKMGTISDSKVARMWATKGGKNLCDVEVALANDKAVTSLNLYTPNDGQYTLAIEEAPENGTLYLTYNGRAIWNLTYSPYTFDLTEGTTEGYGLRIVTSSPIFTDIDNVESLSDDKSQKVIIDNRMYIITSDGAMYDATGKSVR